MVKGFDASSASEGIEDDMFGNAHAGLRLTVFRVRKNAGIQPAVSSWREVLQRTTALPHCPDE